MQITPKQLRDYAHSTGLDGVADALRAAADTIERLEVRAVPEGVQARVIKWLECDPYGRASEICYSGPPGAMQLLNDRMFQLSLIPCPTPPRQILPEGVSLTARIDAFGGAWLHLRVDKEYFAVEFQKPTQRAALIKSAIEKGLPDA